MITLRTGAASAYKTAAQYGAEVVSLLNGGAATFLASPLLKGTMPQCQIAAETYGMSVTYPDGKKIAIQLQNDPPYACITEFVGGARVNPNDATSAFAITSLSLVLSDDAILLATNVSGNNGLYIGVITPATAERDGTTTSRLFVNQWTPGTATVQSAAALGYINDGTQNVRKSVSIATPVFFPWSTASVPATGVWSPAAADFVRVPPRLLSVTNTGEVIRPSISIVLWPHVVGWDEILVVGGKPHRLVAVHTYSSTSTYVLVES